MRNPLSTLADALRHEAQTPETRTENGTGSFTAGNVDTVSAPEDRYDDWLTYKTTPFINAGLGQYAADVVEPGCRMVADSDETEAFFNGGDDAPDGTPDGGFLENAGIIAGQTHQDFTAVLRQAALLYVAAGDVLAEHVKGEDGEKITGFMCIPPWSVTLKTLDKRPILLSPDASGDEIIQTKRGEAAAYLQYHKRSVLGQRGKYDGKDVVPLSQNDVTKIARDPDPGELWGTPATHSVRDLVRGLKQILKDNENAIQTKAYGIWSLAFETGVVEAGDEVIVTEWSANEQSEFIEEKIGSEMGPGDIIGHDGTVTFEKFEGEIADGLLNVINLYIKLIVSALPVPLYAVGFEENINQFVTTQQERRYEKRVIDLREELTDGFLPAMKRVAEQRDLDTSGMDLVLEPDDDDSPIRSMDADELEAAASYGKLIEFVFGDKAYQYFDREYLADLIMQLPGDALDEAAFEESDTSEESPPPVEELPDLAQPPESE
ncbi:hypothetical protein [Halopelagius fulvigenes]|uniref:Portal protein n=1 Tax=Halopelagius fulvigenes TaxID=1198324 RepID=A0ABD5TYV2_9EURY